MCFGSPIKATKPSEVSESPVGSAGDSESEAIGKQGKEKQPPRASRELYASNLSLLVFFGVGLSGWCYYYTDYFPEVVGLLGLGGLFAWLAFLSNLVSEFRKGQLQSWFEEAVLDRHHTWLGLGLLALLFCLWATGRGTLELASMRDDIDRAVEIRSYDPARSGWGGIELEKALASRTHGKYLLPVVWGGERNYRVKVSSLPAQTVKVQAWHKTLLAVPTSFLRRPVLLVRPSPVLSASLENAPGQLIVLRNRAPELIAKEDPYKGEAIWLGCDSDVALPAHLLDRWRLEMAAGSIPEVAMFRWLHPISPAQEIELNPGEEVRISLRRSDGGEVASAVARIRPVNRPQDFPQEVKLDVPH